MMKQSIHHQLMRKVSNQIRSKANVHNIVSSSSRQRVRVEAKKCSKPLFQSYDPNHKYEYKYNQCHYYTSSSVHQRQNNDNDNDDDSTKEWIPPQRPLSGDLGKSEIYAKKLNSQQETTTDALVSAAETGTSIDDEEDNDDGFVDIDDIDLKELKKQLEVLGEDVNTSFSEKDFDGLWDDIQNDVGDDDDDFDYSGAFENDEVLNEIMSDVEFDTDDEEVLVLQSEMIDERIEQLKEEDKLRKMMEEDEEKEQGNEKIPTPNIKASAIDFIDEDESELDEFLKEKNNLSSKNKSNTNASQGPDWLSTRRSKLSPSDMLTPDESSAAQKIDGEIKVIKDTLLSSNEIIACLTNLGASDVELVIPDEKTLPFLGWNGLIIATGSSYSHIRVLTDSIVDNLRKRNLAKKGVVGALYGSEGGEDTSSTRRRNGLPKKMDDGWISVDCGNFIVHVQDDVTRRSIDLEGLWSPGERGKSGRELRSVNLGDDEAVEDYVANNPVPDEYSESLIAISGDFWGDGQMRGGFGNLGKSSPVSKRWTPGSNEKRKPKNRGRGR